MPRRFPFTSLMVLAATVAASAQALSDADLKRHIEVRALGTELLREGFESLEEDCADEQFFGAARAAYWQAADASTGRSVTATLIDRLEF